MFDFTESHSLGSSQWRMRDDTKILINDIMFVGSLCNVERQQIVDITPYSHSIHEKIALVMKAFLV